jgi:hypothetical protein
MPPTRKVVTVHTRLEGARTVESDLSDVEAINLLRGESDGFAQDLVRQYDEGRRPLSERQLEWVHYLAVEQRERDRLVRQLVEAVVQDEQQMGPILALFQTARERLKFPVVRLVDADGVGYRLFLAGDNARYPDSIYVKSEKGRRFLGRISPDGLFLPARDVGFSHPGMIDLLWRFAASPEQCARDYGRWCGRCCFCALELTDQRSTLVGYGPVCAEHYGLPWGEK